MISIIYMGIEKLRSSEETEIRQRVLGLLAAGVLRLVERWYKFDLYDEASADNLREANELLKKGSIIIFVNHPSMKDPLIIPFLKKHLFSVGQVGIPIAEKYVTLNFDKPESFIIKPLTSLIRILGIKFLKTQQHGVNVRPIFEFLGRRRREGEEKTFNQMDEFLNSPTPGNIVGITPTGTRTDEIKGKFHSGLARLMENHPNIPVLPVAMKYKDGRVIVRVGEAFTLEEIKDSLPEVDVGKSLSLDEIEIKRITAYCEDVLLNLFNSNPLGK